MSLFPMRAYGRLWAGSAVLLVSVANAQTTPAYTVFTSRQPTTPQAGQPTRARVTLTLNNATVQDALHQVVTQAKLALSWSRAKVPLTGTVTATLRNVTVQEALSVVLRGTGARAELSSDGQTVFIARADSNARGDARRAAGIVAGRVTDSVSGKGVPGAAVSLQGTTLRATTSDNGQFVLRDVPTGDRALRVRAFGYRPATQPVTVVDSERTTVQIVLRPAPTVLAGTVTTATGVQQRREVGADITVLNADSIQRIAPVKTITDMLEARVPGLIVMRTSGVPGAPSRLRLRGSSSVERSNDPIVIVDGVRTFADQSSSGNTVGNFSGPSAIDQIDPNTIATIEVFKGPSASAMYGSDAGNGVVVITTKRGQAGRTRWNLALAGGQDRLPSGGYPINYFGFGHRPSGEDNGCNIPSRNQGCTLDSVIAYQALNDPRYNIFGTGTNRSASLSVSGGSGALTYALTASAADNQGVVKLPPLEEEYFESAIGTAAPEWMRRPDRYGTWGGTSRVDLPIGGSRGTVSLTNSLFRSVQQQSSLQDAIGTLQRVYPPDTSYYRLYANLYNPVLSNFSHRAQFKGWTATNAATVQWAVRPWLPLAVTAGINSGAGDNSDLLPRNYAPFTSPDTVGTYSLQRTNTQQQTLNATTSLRVPGVGRIPGARVPIGFNWTSVSQNTFTGLARGIPVGVETPTAFTCQADLTSTNTCSQQANVSQTTYGWFVAPTLDFNSRFFVSPAIRFDGGSASGARGGVNGGAFSPFPKLDFSWLAVNQPERPVLGAITLLRPRLAFGIAGVQPAPGDKLRLFNVGSTTPPGAFVPTDLTTISTLGNPELRPERSREFEGGVDLDLWNQRLSLTVTPYYKLRYDAIVNTPVAPSINGGGLVRRNVGNIRNSGVDATVSARVLDRRTVSWSVLTNVHKNTNVVTSLARGMLPIVNADGSRIVAGYPLNGRWARPIVGFSDTDGSGLVDPDEVVVGDSMMYVGAQEPNYELSASTTLGLFNGRLTVNTAVDYQNGLTQLNQVPGATSLWNPSLSPAEQAAFAAATASGSQAYTSNIGFMQTVNTLRWQSLSVTYQAPAAAARWFRASSMSVALQGSNLGLKTNYRGKDPNVNAFSKGNLTADAGQVPLPRTWQLRVTVGN